MNSHSTTRRNILKSATALATASFASVNAFAQLPNESNTLVVGQSAVLTGPSAQLGIEMRDGIQAAFDEKNATGGINRKLVKLKTLDDGYEPDRAKNNTQQLVDDNRLVALLGYVGTPTSLASLPVITASGTPLLGAFTGAVALRNPVNPFVFNIRASYDEEATVLLRHLVIATGKNERIVIVCQDDAYGLAVKTSVEKAANRLGVKPVAYVTIKRNTTDVSAAADAIVAVQATSVVVGSVYGVTGRLVVAVRAKKFYPQFASVSFVGTSGLLDQFGRQAEGIAIAQVVPYPSGGSILLMREFRSAMQASGMHRLTYGSMEGYIAGRVMCEAIARCGSNVTRAQLRDKMENLKVDVGGFNVAFSPSSHQGSTFTEMTVVREDGSLRV